MKKQEKAPESKKGPVLTRRRVLVGAAGLMAAAGAGLIAYPYINEALYRNEVAGLRADFEKRAQGADASVAASDGSGRHIDVEGLYAYLRAENERLFTEGQKELVDAFSYLQPAVDLSAWGIEDNIIGFLRVPAIDIDLPIRLGANDEQMARGAVHLTQTSYPIGGDNTNSVIAGHRAHSRGLSMFVHVPDLEIGDAIYVDNFRETLTYRVVETKVIEPKATNTIRIQAGRDLLTLITCHPYGVNTHRFVLYAERA